MGRLLDEDDVLNAVDQRIQELQSHPEFRRKHADIDLYGIKEYIRQIPTAQQWIPCSERLPEKEDIYLVAFEKDSLLKSDVTVSDSYWKDGKWQYAMIEVYEHKMPKFVIEPIEELKIAKWMPLPGSQNGEHP